MTDTIMENQNNVEAQETENLNAAPKKKWAKWTITGFATCALVIGSYYAYGILFPDPWYVRALAIFGF